MSWSHVFVALGPASSLWPMLVRRFDALTLLFLPSMCATFFRYDEKKQANPAAEIKGFSFDEPTGAGVKAAFKRAGLGPR